MGIETNGGDTWQYGDEEIKEEVLDCFNEDEVDKQLSTVLMKQAESLYEKVEENMWSQKVQWKWGAPIQREVTLMMKKQDTSAQVTEVQEGL